MQLVMGGSKLGYPVYQGLRSKHGEACCRWGNRTGMRLNDDYQPTLAETNRFKVIISLRVSEET